MGCLAWEAVYSLFFLLARGSLFLATSGACVASGAMSS